jgi:hypothetical protein
VNQYTYKACRSRNLQVGPARRISLDLVNSPCKDLVCWDYYISWYCIKNLVNIIYQIFDAVSRNVIIPTNKVLTRAVYKIKTDSSGWLNLQVPRSCLVCVYCFYMFLRFDSHENRAGLVNLMCSRFSKARSHLSRPTRQTRLAIDNCATTHALSIYSIYIIYLESI